MDGPSLPARIARVAFAIIGSGIVAGIAFLILIQEAERRGHTDLDFNHTLGNIVEGAQTQDATTSSALGVIGDTAAPTGLVAAIVLSGVLMAVHGLVIVPLVRRGWFVQGLVLAVVTFLAVGLIYPPLASEHLEEPLGALRLRIRHVHRRLDRGGVPRLRRRGRPLLRADPQRGVVDAAGRRARGRPGGGRHGTSRVTRTPRTAGRRSRRAHLA